MGVNRACLVQSTIHVHGPRLTPRFGIRILLPQARQHKARLRLDDGAASACVSTVTIKHTDCRRDQHNVIDGN